jgi:deoxyribonuclease V
VKSKDAIAWPENPAEAVQLQKQMAGTVVIRPLPAPPRFVAAVDLAHLGPPRRPTRQVAGVIVYDRHTRQTVERHALVRPITFPYIPGLLSFREAPAALAVIERVRTGVDIFLIDGQGLAHPRRMGIASHIGVLLQRPTVGCAKSRLTGTPEKQLPEPRGAWVNLLDKNEVVGALVRTRTNVKPLYVSVGNLITLPEAVDLVLALADRYRLPEPARLAHNYVTGVARGEAKPD